MYIPLYALFGFFGPTSFLGHIFSYCFYREKERVVQALVIYGFLFFFLPCLEIHAPGCHN